MISLDENEARFVLMLLAWSGHGGVVQGQDWRQTAGALLSLEAKLRAALMPPPAVSVSSTAGSQEVK